MATATADTFSTVDLSTRDGKKFLRRVEARWREEWQILADDSDGWRIRFWRRVDPASPGDAGATVTVETTETVANYSRPGIDGDAGEYRRPVAVPAPRRVTLTGTAARTAAGLLANGWRLCIESNRGSVTSSDYGLAFLTLEAYRPGAGERLAQTVTIGETVCVNGAVVCRGPVDC